MREFFRVPVIGSERRRADKVARFGTTMSGTQIATDMVDSRCQKIFMGFRRYL